ncbi:MAG: NAD(P) transhydrogenase subunit alpha [Deltaproteobacteria bacterium]|nr:NAD(P) transhydrogenase subunit alpha [Deltaproteobacteria bacterium]
MLSIIIMLGTFFFILLVGYFLVSRVPTLLHTPLMSATNAISSITILGAFVLFSKSLSTEIIILVIVAIITASFNCIGGFLLTDRMFNMFKGKQ